VSKETIQVTFTPGKEAPKLIDISAFNFDGSKKSLNNLTERIHQLKKDFPDSLIQVRTPIITGPQIESLFEAGAIAHRILLSEDKE